MEGGPGPANIGFGIMAAVLGGGSALSAGWAALTTSSVSATLATTTTAVMTNPLTYIGRVARVRRGGAARQPRLSRAVRRCRPGAAGVGGRRRMRPRGSPRASEVWGEITRGKANLLPYFISQPGKLVVGVLSAQARGDKEGIVRAFLVLRKEANVLARSLGAKTIRLEADVVTNTEELLPNLLKMGSRESAENPFTFFLEIAVK